MYYHPDEPYSSQFVPEDEAYAQRAAMDEDDRKLAEQERRLEDEDSDYVVSSQEPNSSQSQPEDCLPSDGEEDSQEYEDDSYTEGPNSPRIQYDLDAYNEQEDSMDTADFDPDTDALDALAMPETISAEILDEWRDIGRRVKTYGTWLTVDHKYAIRLAFERIYGLSAKETYTIENIFQEERVYDKTHLSTRELHRIVRREWKDTFVRTVS
ncbi:hypothetical protein PHLGIDRAFT_114520 [Phlebiopsis gigantea 11061_1 CR5-6]|uniref:Uncharacterized protein n=1 Tax=Phlebiopsis gigantea (strain 11061_1 CR5-6) TaxID=745531 RepID=A0A0C3S5Q1_PHLG1|nr:hypothetical protein PHLGIDRAFT_114520 [Phlebiopsis gigantea 11061_1 CR5-6]